MQRRPYKGHNTGHETFLCQNRITYVFHNSRLFDDIRNTLSGLNRNACTTTSHSSAVASHIDCKVLITDFVNNDIQQTVSSSDMLRKATLMSEMSWVPVIPTLA